MDIIFDPDQDVLHVSLKNEIAHETSQIAPGLILDYDEDGNVIGLEIRQASKKVDDPYSVSCTVSSLNQNKPQIPNRV